MRCNYPLNSLLISAAVLTTSCSHRQAAYADIDTSDIPKERSVRYQQRHDSLVVERILEYREGLQLFQYVIADAGLAGIGQKALLSSSLTNLQFDSIRHTWQKEPRGWTTDSANQELFVQIRPTSQSAEGLALLDLRHEVETEIDDALITAQLGGWTAGDLGPGGGNMLFSCSNFNEAQRRIITVLRAHKLEKNAVIARQITTKKDDWTYEVLYPIGYSGTFNSM